MKNRKYTNRELVLIKVMHILLNDPYYKKEGWKRNLNRLWNITNISMDDINLLTDVFGKRRIKTFTFRVLKAEEI